MDFGILTLIPPIVIIIFALVTKRTFEALLIGAVIGFFMTDGIKGVLNATVYGFCDVAAENIWMIMVFGLLGAFSYLMTKSKGTYGFGVWVRKFAKGEKTTLIVGWILGIIVFIDDYINILTVSTALRDTCDRYKTPREMLAYVIDSTGAPVCVLIPISTWAVFYASVLAEEPGMAGFGTPLEMYVDSLPFILSLIHI